jgi:hypothetical protein
MELPMLDDSEFALVAELYSLGLRTARKGGSRHEQFKALLDHYNGITGFGETEPNAIMHHRISMYGPPCEACGKPYRTPQATFCAACGRKRMSDE